MERNSHMRPTFKGTFKGVFKGSFRSIFKGSSHVRPRSCSSLSRSPCAHRTYKPTTYKPTHQDGLEDSLFAKE